MDYCDAAGGDEGPERKSEFRILRYGIRNSDARDVSDREAWRHRLCSGSRRTTFCGTWRKSGKLVVRGWIMSESKTGLQRMLGVFLSPTSSTTRQNSLSQDGEGSQRVGNGSCTLATTQPTNWLTTWGRDPTQEAGTTPRKGQETRPMVKGFLMSLRNSEKTRVRENVEEHAQFCRTRPKKNLLGLDVPLSTQDRYPRGQEDSCLVTTLAQDESIGERTQLRQRICVDNWALTLTCIANRTNISWCGSWCAWKKLNTHVKSLGPAVKNKEKRMVLQFLKCSRAASTSQPASRRKRR